MNLAEIKWKHSHLGINSEIKLLAMLDSHWTKSFFIFLKRDVRESIWQ